MIDQVTPSLATACCATCMGLTATPFSLVAADVSAVHFARHIERDEVKHEEKERAAEEEPFKALRFFLDAPPSDQHPYV